jgi:hypothetical protein
MESILLESPLKLVILELAGILVLIWWVRRSVRPAGRWLGGYLALCAALLAVQALVVTDAEKIRRITREIAEAVEFGRINVIRAHLADDFAAGGYDRDGFMDLVYRRLETYRVEGVWVGGAELQIGPDDARIDFTARARVGTEETGLQPYMERWRLGFRRDGKTWLVTGVEDLGMPGLATGVRPGP